MKIFVVGAAGNIGTRIRNEAIARGHQVTGMTRDASRLQQGDGLSVHIGDVTNADTLAEAIKGHDAVVVSHGSPYGDPNMGPNTIIAAVSVIAAMRKAGVKRLFWVGGAASLFNADGRRLLDVLDLPAGIMSGLWSMAALLYHLKTVEDLEWTFLSPAAMIWPGERTGKFRLGKDELVTDAEGKSSISYEDYAIAVLDELESPQHVRERFTLGY